MPLNNQISTRTNIAIADDHVLLRKGLAGLVGTLGYQVVLDVNNGSELIAGLESGSDPDLVLVDINMPVMDGYDCALWIKENRPLMKVVALSMYDDEKAIVKMLKNGARGYILKDSEPRELKLAIDAVLSKGYYYSEMVTGRLIHSIHKMEDSDEPSGLLATLNGKETEFLKLACSELTYKEIASIMGLSPRTIDGYRDSLFEKLNIKTRTGLAIFAIKNGLVKI